MKNDYITLVTDGSGDADVTAAHSIVGLVHSIEVYASALDATADITISITDTGSTVDKTLLTLTNNQADAEYFVYELAHDTVGAPLTAIYKDAVAIGKVRVVIDEGGAANAAKVVINYYTP